jgi:hypothetical protein
VRSTRESYLDAMGCYDWPDADSVVLVASRCRTRHGALVNKIIVSEFVTLEAAGASSPRLGTALRLAATRTFGSGVVVHTYHPASG